MRPGRSGRRIERVSDEKGRAAVLAEVSLILAAVFWGLNYTATKYAADFVPLSLLVTFRFALGGLLLLGSMLRLERSSSRGIFGVGLSLLGVGLVMRDGLGAGDTSLLGDLLSLFAAMFVGSYTVFSMSMLERYSPLAVATYPTLFAAPVTLILSSPFLPGVAWESLGLGVWAAIGYAAIFATAFTFAAWQRGISRIGANRVLVYQYLITLTGVASGIAFFDEDLGPDELVGGAVILFGVYLARRR